MSPNRHSYFGGNSTCAQQEVTWDNGNSNKQEKQLWEGTEILSTQSDFSQGS